MSDIPTWHERAMAHPDHQSGMISEDMIRARMAEEVEDLRAEVEKLRALAGKHPPTVRSAARLRQPLNGADAQALEGALAATDGERIADRLFGLALDNQEKKWLAMQIDRLIRRRMAEAWEEGWFDRDCQEADWDKNPYRGRTEK